MRYFILLTVLFFSTTIFGQNNEFAQWSDGSWHVEVHPDSVVGKDLMIGPHTAYNRLTGKYWLFNPSDSSWGEIPSLSSTATSNGITGNIAYVSTTGDNESAEIGNPLRPFADILSAIDSVQSTDDTTNVTIYIYSGDYTVDGTGRQVNLTPFDTTTFIHEGGFLTFDNFDDTAEGFGDFINTARDVRDACIANIYMPNTSIEINATGSAQIPIYYGHLNSEVNINIKSLVQLNTPSFQSRVARIGCKRYNANFDFVRAQGELMNNATPKTESGDTTAVGVNRITNCEYMEQFLGPIATVQFADKPADSSYFAVNIGHLLFEDVLDGGAGGWLDFGFNNDTVVGSVFDLNIDYAKNGNNRSYIKCTGGSFNNSRVNVNVKELYAPNDSGQIIEYAAISLINSTLNFELENVRGQFERIVSDFPSDATPTDSISSVIISGQIAINQSATSPAIIQQTDFAGNYILKDLIVSGSETENLVDANTYKILGVYTNMANNAGDTEEIGTIIYDAAVGDIR